MVFIREELILSDADFKEFAKGLGKIWVNLYVSGIEDILSFNLRRNTIKVLFALMQYVTFDNEIDTCRQQIAEKLQIHPDEVTKAFATLRKNWIIYPVAEGSPLRRVKYVFNPRYVWKGPEEGRIRRLKELDDLNLVANVRAAREAELE